MPLPPMVCGQRRGHEGADETIGGTARPAALRHRRVEVG